MAELSSSRGPLGSGRGGVTGFVGGSASSVFAHGGALVNSGQPDPALYAYTNTAHVHAVTAVSGLGSFAYDDNGNMTRRVEKGTTYTQTFDVKNRLVSVAVSGGGTTQYQYDANGQLLKKIAPDGTVTVYLGLVEYEIDGGVTETTSYYSVPGARVVRVNTTLSYVLTDHLGSSSVTLDSNGVVAAELRYYAYGETRVSTGSTPTERLYTGQLRQDELGLDYFNARWYHGALGRFLSADTIVPGPGNPQAFNRYAYVLGNPLKYKDPSGHYYCTGGELDAAACTAWVEQMLLDLEKSGTTGADLVKRFRVRDAALMATMVRVNGCSGGNCLVPHPGFQFDFTPFVSGGMVVGNTLSLNDRYASSSLSSGDLGLVGHELTHLVKQDTYRNSTRGEAEAYAQQAQILLDLGLTPLDIMDKASKTNLTSAEDLAAFKDELVSWALAVDLPSAVVYWLSPTGAPRNQHARNGSTQLSTIVTPVTPVQPRQTPK